MNDFILHLDETTPGAPLPLGLEGLPTKDGEGHLIHYRRVLVARCRPFVHRGTGASHDITTARADEWVRNTMALAAAGVKPFVPGEHRETFNAADNHGYVVKLERDGENLFAVLALHGDESLKIAARNGRSIYIKRDMIDAAGKVYAGESLHHLALVPNPALPDLGGMARIAASADRPAMSVPVFTLAAATTPQEHVMDKNIAKKFRETFKVAADVADDKIPDQAGEKALALSAEVETLKARAESAERERDTAKQQVVALSADAPKKPDAPNLAMYMENIETKRDLAVKSGALTEAEAKAIDALLTDSNGQPTTLSLSAVGARGKPLAFELWGVLAKLSGEGIRAQHATARDGDARDVAALALAGDAKADKPPTAERIAEMLNQTPLGQSVVAAALTKH